mgnify:CR=1 FL=1
MFYDLASSSWGEEEIAAMHAVIASGRFTMGEHVRRFEELPQAKAFVEADAHLGKVVVRM